MSDPSNPDPQADAPPGTPAKGKPADPSVYGGQWGEGGPEKPPGPNGADRPDKIETPPEKN